MSFSMYDLSIPVMLRGFDVLSGYLEKASEHSFDSGTDTSTLVNARLAPDMLTLAGQVQRASDNAKGAVGRLAGIDVPSFPDTETTFDELRLRVSRTVEFLKTIKREQLDGTEERVLDLRFRSVNGKLRGDMYLIQVLIPNFFFHISTVHAILRSKGLPVGKKDYLGEFATA